MENNMARGVVQCAESEGGCVYAVAVYRRIVAGYADVADGGYGVWMVLMLFVWFSLVALMLSAPAVSKRFQRFGHWIDRFCGGALALLGIKVISG